MDGKPRCHWVSDRQMGMLREVSEQTSLSVSEVMRRMYDHCLQPVVLNQLVPSMSGQINVGK